MEKAKNLACGGKVEFSRISRSELPDRLKMLLQGLHRAVGFASVGDQLPPLLSRFFRFHVDISPS
jgi:hypothetical protein